MKENMQYNDTCISGTLKEGSNIQGDAHQNRSSGISATEALNENSQEIYGYICEYRKEFPANFEILLKFASCHIRVKVNDESLLNELNRYFDNFVIPFPTEESGIDIEETVDISISAHEAPVLELDIPFTIKQPDPGKRKIKEEYADFSDGRIVRKRLTGMHFFFGREEHLAIGPCLENSNQVINFINNRYIEWELCNGALLGHAAAVAWKGKGAAVAGFSGAGKSTFALHMMNRGTTFISNDRLMIRKRENADNASKEIMHGDNASKGIMHDDNSSKMTMFGVAKLPRINPGTILNNPNLLQIMSDEEIRLFSSLPKEELWELEHKFDASIDECFGPDKFVLEAPMHALAILDWKHTDEPLKVEIVKPRERMDLLPAFMKSTGLFFMPDSHCKMPEPTPDVYADYLSNCTVIEFSGGVDFEKAAEIYIHFLETGSLS
ncbi:HPr kinase [Desulfamplus magnetovallimortis]|uniref:HPr kinase n=1 Tax=Desulfamplus magnetovallimortis TaxID=1246637 RepID=A0A1W1HJR3_9BACT|nr:HprK-related kinase B [Desulfamplus magnetovallimortis]SLM32645.1 HPr kinase [Desulfamplus magnetovallimortis]